MLAQNIFLNCERKKSLIYAVIRERNQRRRDKDQTRPQGAFPWLWRRKRPGDEVGQRRLFFHMFSFEERDVCTQARSGHAGRSVPGSLEMESTDSGFARSKRRDP